MPSNEDNRTGSAPGPLGHDAGEPLPETDDMSAMASCVDVRSGALVGGRDRPADRTRSARPAAADLAAIRRVLSGDGNAFRALIDRHQSRVSGMMWRFSRDPETHGELVQDVFVQAYEGLASYRAEAPFEHWLSRIAVRVGYRHWKRGKRAPEIVSLDEWRDLPNEPAEDLEPNEAGELLHRLLAHLPPRDRLVLTLRYVEDHTVERTAELTGWSETMVKVQAWRARKKLKALFDRAQGGADR
jgi:RNA polymerase sigma-70 factor (ECF subfamily)